MLCFADARGFVILLQKNTVSLKLALSVSQACQLVPVVLYRVVSVFFFVVSCCHLCSQYKNFCLGCQRKRKTVLRII